MKTQKRIWTRKELIIAYYLTKWGENGLGANEEEIATIVIGNTTFASLQMQKACFRHIMDIPGTTLEHGSQAMRDVVEEFKDTTMTNVRKIVLEAIDGAGSALRNAVTERMNNEIVEKRRKALNAYSQTVYENKMKYIRRFKNLRKIN